MTVYELKPDNQYGYFDNREEYDQWYQTNLHLHPSQIRMDGHTYDDETNEVVFKVRPTNEEVRAIAFDAPPWVQGIGKAVEDDEDTVPVEFAPGQPLSETTPVVETSVEGKLDAEGDEGWEVLSDGTTDEQAAVEVDSDESVSLEELTAQIEAEENEGSPVDENETVMNLEIPESKDEPVEKPKPAPKAPKK